MAEASGDPGRTARLLAIRAGMRGIQGRADELDDLRAAERLAAAPTPDRVRVLSQLSSRLLVYGEHDEGGRLGREAWNWRGRWAATATSPAGGDRGHGRRDGQGDLAPLERVLHRDLEAWVHARTLNTLVHCLLNRGRAAEALALAADGLATVEDAGIAYSAGTALAVNEVEALYRVGRWDEAAGTLQRRLDRHHGAAFRLQMMIWRTALLAARGGGPRPDPEALAVRSTRASRRPRCRSPR